MRRFPVAKFASIVVLSTTLIGLRLSAVSADDGSPTLSAYLDGKAISLADVSRYHCDDFAYPVIQCSVSAVVMSSRTLLVTLLSNVDYVTVYEGSSYFGASMTMSQNYGALALIGWNDRISSFKARNSETGAFFVDWFSTGSEWQFCCNTAQSSLGAYDNTFSSVERT